MRTLTVRSINVRMPRRTYKPSSANSALHECKVKNRRPIKKSQRPIIYVARIDHLHYCQSSMPQMRGVHIDTALPIDPSTLGWGAWLHYKCKKYAWVWSNGVAIVIFLLSRINIGVGFRLGGSNT